MTVLEFVPRDPGSATRVVADGKFLRAGAVRFLVKGVSYGTFAPDVRGYQFPSARRIAEDFRQMAELGLNSVRVYTPPSRDLLDEADRNGLRLMVGLPWSQHVAFLDDRRLVRSIRRDIAAQVRALSGHPAVLMFALGNEIPAGVVRWHGRTRVERFLRQLYLDAKWAAPGSLFTYVNFPPTEFLDLSCYDVCAFNLYLHREEELRAYLARLQHVAGDKPLLLAEAGADSTREGAAGQAAITSMHFRAAFEEGASGAVAFTWTDDWWRGGQPVADWSFGLVDRERRPKPAAAAVSAACADAPFAAPVRATWPKVSVVVCAHDAAGTLEDCLTSLERITYPDYEIVLVNDGSRDRTGEIGRAHPRVRVIATPNHGLGAARNTGLAVAEGAIVAYTDADVRVDPDWLTFLVQPLLGSNDIVGAGGPNVVPPDDPPLAQCIARSPGGPTHVLLDDRQAEHVPGCNMAFRREALLAIGGFNPIYRRAGDDVDICWRLQARGWKIGFAASALVWHHHRPSVRGYWRQQVGYGEGETWLMAHHPEKFLDGMMLWRGRMYSPLPFVRSLWGRRVNVGVWGTAAFPSVYRTDAHPLSFLPHSVAWQLTSFALALAAGGVALLGTHGWAAASLLGMGLAGMLTTVAKNVSHALRSEVGSLARRPLGRLRYRATIAYLHLLQPFARAGGRVRGMLAPPEVFQPAGPVRSEAGPRPSARDAGRALLLLSGSVVEDRFWSESRTSTARVLTRLVNWLRRSRVRHTVAVDDGWSHDRDVSVLVGRWAWLDLRALVEEHEGGRSLLHVGTHLRPTAFGAIAGAALGIGLIAGGATGIVYRWPLASAAAALLTVLLALFTTSRTARAAASLRRGTKRVAAAEGMVPLPSGPARDALPAPSLLRTYGLRGAAVLVLAILSLTAGAVLRGVATAQVAGAPPGARPARGPILSVWLDAPGGVAVSPAGAIYFADSYNAVIRRIDGRSLVITPFAGDTALGTGFAGDGGPATAAQLNAPAGVAIAPDGAVIVADAQNHRIRRIDGRTGLITTVAGSGEAGYGGDGGPAVEAALHQPSAVACAPNGDIYIADTMNNRIRMIERATGLIHTVVGTGEVAESGPVGDGGPAIEARLFMPSDVALAPGGDLYIADMHHNLVRRVDATTGVITTVAGDGSFGNAPEGVVATEGSLAGPAGIALLPGSGPAPTLFIADSYNGLVRMVGADGIMRTLNDDNRIVLGAPSRLAFAPKRRWLYVADPSEGRLVALTIPQMLADSLSASEPPEQARAGALP